MKAVHSRRSMPARSPAALRADAAAARHPTDRLLRSDMHRIDHMSTSDIIQPITKANAIPAVQRFNGKVVYHYAMDIAYDTKRSPLKTLLGQPVTSYKPDTGKRAPRDFYFYQPQTVRMPPVTLSGPNGPMEAQCVIKLFPVGALSITLHAPFQQQTLTDLVDYHDVDDAQRHARELAQKVIDELGDWLIRPVVPVREDEAYTVFCLDAVSAAEMLQPSTEAWLRDHRRAVAALLTQEADAHRLSEQEISETAQRSLSYYAHDLVVIDWDAALIIDEPTQFDATLHIMELANVQLAELESYDRMIDSRLARAYDLSHVRWKSRRVMSDNLREFRLDMARFRDELSNTTKFFGDWHLARVYQALYERFHLASWYNIVKSKIDTLDDLYRIYKQDQVNKVMVFLEAAIVLLFILDLVLLVVVGAI